jgi:thiol-disulfide isomerase/thioredoxin
MKKLIFTSLIIIAFSLISNASNLKVTLKAPKEFKNALYSVCVSSYKASSMYYDDHELLFTSSNGKFDIELEPGRYRIAMVYPHTQAFYYNIYLSEKTSTVEFNIKLDRLCIPAKIDKVELAGDYNGWEFTRNVILKYDKSKKIWYLPNSEIPANLRAFKFLINNTQYCYLEDLPIDDPSTWASPSNHYIKNNKDLVMKPSDFKQGNPSPEVSGNFDTAYNSLCNRITDIFSNVSSKISKISTKEELEDFHRQYNTTLSELNYLVDKTPESLKWATISAQLQMNELNTQADMVFASRAKNSAMMNSIRKSESYLNQIKNTAQIYKDMPFNNLTLSESEISNIWDIEDYLENYDLFEELGVPYGYYKQKLVDAAKKLDNQNVNGTLLYIKASSLQHNNPEKATAYFQMLLTQYPNYNRCKNGNIANALSTLKVKEGAKAPDFSVTTLAALSGKYVFIDFWGTWCAPCRQEIPNVKALASNYSDDKLFVLGLASDPAETVKKFISENDIKYENAVLSNEITQKYGIRYFPTTLLIGPDGVIIAKDLRGDLIEQVKNLIK